MCSDPEHTLATLAHWLARQLAPTPGAPPRAGSLPLVHTNSSVLTGGGRSLAHLAHPWLPQALLGFGGRR